jgi:hypothetical protein
MGAQRLLALGVVLGLEVPVLDAGLLLEALGPGEDALVEGFVELAAEIVHDGGLHRGGVCLGVSRVGRERGREPGERRTPSFQRHVNRSLLDGPRRAQGCA